MGIALFQKKIFQLAAPLYRDLPWRNTHDPYAIWISEVMLQQTQVSRVDGRWQRWLMCFPNVQALAQAKTTEVLQEWQGLGYNRRALSVTQHQTIYRNAAQIDADIFIGNRAGDFLVISTD